MDVYQIDALLRDLLGRALQTTERRRDHDSLIPGLMADCRETERQIRAAVPPDEIDRLQDRLLIELGLLNGRCDQAIHLAVFWLVGEAVEHDFESTEVARRAARVRDALLRARLGNTPDDGHKVHHDPL